ncbi:hypothetical protein Godav_018858 [Gossypium davidsonii]|uniref:Uncharacterized protein n=1 Tax=Gossypium davidsonii TaxID=34287 RepID=A0A7J8QXS6_GOSDV|nr:hypothetical protein [Gossypium davidsonii]
MITDDGAWNLDLFGLLEKVIRRIVGIPSPHSVFMESEKSGVADSFGNIKGLNGNGLSQNCKTVITSAWVMLIGNVSLGLSLGAFRRILISSFFKAHPGVAVMYEAGFAAAEENCKTEIGVDSWTDTLEAAKVIQESPSNGSNYALIRRIHQLLS